MRQISAGLFISLDGVVETPDRWGFQYMNEEMTRAISVGIAQADAVLLGKNTYLEFARLWPGQGSQVAMADFLNQSHKYVVTSTLKNLDWQPATILSGDLQGEIKRLKQQPGLNIQVPGSPTLVRFLLQAGLLDVLSLSICPVVVGAGMRLFDESLSMIGLKLIHSAVLSTGVIGATYQPETGDSQRTKTPINFPQAATRQ